MKQTKSLPAWRLAFAASLLAGGLLASAGRALATSYYYDADGTGGGTALNYGNGIWSTTNALWLNGAAGTAGGNYIGWTNSTSDSALIGAGSGYTAATSAFTITLGENITAGSIGVSNGLTQNLTISGSTSNYTLTIGSGGIGVNQTTAGTTTIDAVLTGSTVFTKFNSGTLILTQNNNYTSGTNVEGGSANTPGGTLQVGNGGTVGALGSGAISFVLFVGTGTQNRVSTLSFNRSDAITVASSVKFDSANTLGGIIQQAGGNKLTMTNTVTLGTAATNPAVLTYNIGRTSAVPVDTEVSGAIQGTGSIAKATGTGVLQFSGTNTYTGTTSVSAGTLLVTGNSSAATGNVSVASGATLGGTGNIGGATTVTGILSVGTSSGTGSTPATLTFSNAGTALTLNGSTLLDINGTAGKGVAGGNDLVNLTSATGALVYGGTLNVSLNGFTPAANSVYDLFDFATQSGTFSSITVGDGSAFNGTLNYATGVLTITAVPEPSTWATGVLCAGTAAFFLRRRMRRA